MNFLNIPILGTIIALVFIYALLSIITSLLIEWWSYVYKSRGKLLRKAIIQMLQDPLNKNYGELLLDNFLIHNLGNAENHRPPQYISANLFSEALIDVIAQQSRHNLKLILPKSNAENAEIKVQPDQDTSPEGKKVFNRFRIGLEEMNPSPLRDTLFSFYDKADSNYDKLKGLLEKWYNDYMERVSGWYKTQLLTKNLIFGFIVAIVLNVDSLHLFKVLNLDPGLRGQIVTMATKVADDYAALADSSKGDPFELSKLVMQNTADSLKLDSAFSSLPASDSLAKIYLYKADSILSLALALNIPIGWNKKVAPISWDWASLFKKNVQPYQRGILAYQARRNRCPSIAYFLGIFISGIALSFGAPFWFEVLVKLVNIRKSGGKPKIESN